MSMTLSQEKLLQLLDERFSTDTKGDNFHGTTSITSGIVVDTDDPLQMGRLRVFVPAHGHDPSKIHLLPWYVYASPFGGVINNSSFERGSGSTTTGAVSYGMWAIPELGSDVIVSCLDGDLRRPIWLGCLFPQQETHTLGNGRYKWSSGGHVDGPLSSANSPIQPAYDNATQAFSNKKDSPEWQSREADYSITAVDGNIDQPPVPGKSSYLDQMKKEITADQQFTFNGERVGPNGYEWTSFSGKPYKSSQVYTWSSPGFATISLDDRIYNNRTKFKSSTGHTIILDDTNERIYIKTNKGASWIEMDSSGNIDGYSERRISLSADLDINLFSKQSVRIQGVEGVYINAGASNSFSDLTSALPSGQIRLQSTDDMHFVSKNLRVLSVDDMRFEAGGTRCDTVNTTYKIQTGSTIDMLINSGNLNLSLYNGNINTSVNGNVNQLSTGSTQISSVSNMQLYSYNSKLDLGAQENITGKSVSGNVSFQAAGMNDSGTGSVNFKAPNSQFSINESSATLSTNGPFNLQSGNGINMQAQSTSDQAQPVPSNVTVPVVSCSVATPISLTGFSGVDLAARAAYNAGFRDQALTIAVAISGAESSYDPTAVGDTGLATTKWGYSYGLWQIRALVNPSAYSYPDTLRVAASLPDPQFNANAAFALSNKGTNFGPWTTYMEQTYTKYISTAVAAIKSMCGDTTDNLSLQDINDIPMESIQTTEQILAAGSSLKPSILFTDTSVVIQTNDDVYISKTDGSSYAILAGIKDKSDETVEKCNELVASVNSCCDNSLTTLQPISQAGVDIPENQISSTYFPYVGGDSEQVMNMENFNNNGKTILT